MSAEWCKSVLLLFFFKHSNIIVVYLLSVSYDEPKSNLKVKVSPSLAQILEKMEVSQREKQEKLGEFVCVINISIYSHGQSPNPDILFSFILLLLKTPLM